MKTLLRTNDWWTNLVVRVALGIVMVPHGVQKLLGWFGGGGLWATAPLFSEKLHISAGLTILVIVSELLGGLGLIAGFLTRVCAFGVFCVMAGAVVLVHWPHGFFMNWSGNQAGEGFEFHILAMATALTLLVTGGGKWSVDSALYRRARRRILIP
ncbi:MAG: DoxX family protein [Syntrophobacteraceae bacterium]|nr:DoxX family protein [Syntrophobacteraceae bacterium]